MSMNPNDNQGEQEYPPPPPYGAPPAAAYPGGQTGTGASFNIQDLFQRWQAVLTQPSVATFDGQQPGANWATILISLVGLGVLQAICGAIQTVEYHNAAMLYGLSSTSNPFASFGDIIGAPIGFFIAAGILFLIARLFGGTGSFLTYAWLLSLAYVPLTAISAVAGFIPLLGGIIALAAGLYELYLSVLATASAHRLSMGRSWLVVLLPTIIVLFLFFLIAIIIAAAIIGTHAAR